MSLLRAVLGGWFGSRSVAAGVAVDWRVVGGGSDRVAGYPEGRPGFRPGSPRLVAIDRLRPGGTLRAVEARPRTSLSPVVLHRGWCRTTGESQRDRDRREEVLVRGVLGLHSGRHLSRRARDDLGVEPSLDDVGSRPRCASARVHTRASSRAATHQPFHRRSGAPRPASTDSCWSTQRPVSTTAAGRPDGRRRPSSRSTRWQTSIAQQVDPLAVGCSTRRAPVGQVVERTTWVPGRSPASRQRSR